MSIYGPAQFTRSTGNPVQVQRTIAVTNPAASYRLVIVNGGLQDDTQTGDYVSSSTIYWNGNLIASPSNFNQQMTRLTLPVTVQLSNTLTVELQGKPGGSITVQLLRGNQAPIAHAGADQTLYVGGLALLDGSTSTDNDGDTLSYRWRITEAPANSHTQLSDSTAIRPEFPVDAYGHYQAELIVNDGFVDSVPDPIAIDTRNSVPVANAGADQSAFVGNTVGLDGGLSHDVDGNTLSYRWSLVEKPEASSTVIIDDHLQQCRIAIDKPGHYVAKLIVNDGELDSEPDLVAIDTQNSKPVANAGPDQINKTVGIPVELDGSLSSDADGDALSYIWSLLHQPVGSSAVVQQADQTKAVFTPDKTGDYVGQLIVNDGQLNSDPATALVTVSVVAPVNNPPRITSSPILAATVGSLYSYDVNADDPDNDTLSYSLSSYPSGMTINPQSGLISWTPAADQTGAQPVNVTVTDGKGGSDSQSFIVTVAPSGLITVPDLVNLSRTAAETALVNAKLSVGTSSFINNPAIPGSVISQTPNAGSLVAVGATVTLTLSLGPDQGLPPDPAIIAPKIDTTVATTVSASTEFLYSGSNPIQTGVAPGTIDAKRVAVIRGKVLDKDNNALPGVTITIKDHPELGQTLSRADGLFDMAVNGGGLLTINYKKTGYLPVQRQVSAPWQNYAFADTAILIQQDAKVTTIDLNDNTQDFQVAQGSQVTDQDGVRQATLLIPKGTQAQIYNPDGSTKPINTLNLRLTEYTVGANGSESMPGPLPPSSAYTYAFEMKADETDVKVDGKDVLFDRPVPFYIDNFLSFPVGTAVPVGYYDRAKAAWIPSDNGKVIKIFAINNGVADIDSDNDNLADSEAKLLALGITAEERTQLASLYQVGKTLWRVQVTHLSTWDCNWPYKMPDDAVQAKNLPPVTDKKVDDPCKLPGSIVECENQVLGETLPITGTSNTLNYRSARVAGRKSNTMQIPLSGATLPSSLKRIDMVVEVAGRRFEQSFQPTPNQTVPFEWDGVDAFGRPVQGFQAASIKIGYAYAPVYATPAALSAAFGRFSGVPLEGNRARNEVRIWQEQTARLGGWTNRSDNLAAWSLNTHHSYDPVAQILYLGDGSQRSVQGAVANNVITTVAGNGTAGFSGDGGRADLAMLNRPQSLINTADGGLYFCDSGNNRIRYIGANGLIRTIAGTGSAGYAGDGGLAAQAKLNEPDGIALGSDGSLYIADFANQRVRQITPDGIIRTIAGTGSAGFSGDNGPAVAAQINGPYSVAVAPDNTVYFSDLFNNRIRRISPDGQITTVAGNGSDGQAADGTPPLTAPMHPGFLALDRDGSLYFTDTGAKIRRLTPSGVLSTVAGNGSGGYSGDGGPATNAQILPSSIVFQMNGSLLITEAYNNRVRKVAPDGIINTLAGTGPTGGFGTGGFNGDGRYPLQTQFNYPRNISVSADGTVYLSDVLNHRVRRLKPSLPGFNWNEFTIPSEDGTELYRFGSTGRHLATLNALTSATLLSFSYDTQGRLSQITDGDGLITQIERDALGNPTAIVAPFGQRSTFSLDSNGYLAKVTNPAGESHEMTYTVDGLLTSFKDPNGNASTFAYDALGRLLTDTNASGGGLSLSRTELADGHIATVTSVLNRVTTHTVHNLSTGDRERKHTQPDNTTSTTLEKTDGTTITTEADGTVTTSLKGPDPRFSMLSPIAKSLQTSTGGLTSNLTSQRSAVLADSNNPLSLTTLTDTVTLNGRTQTTVYDAASKAFTATSAAARQTKAIIDSLGRLTQTQMTGLLPVNNSYDPQGRLATIVQGSGADERLVSFAYNPQGYLDSVTDPVGRQVKYEYDLAGRVTRQILPDNREILFSYDANGNLTKLLPPGRPGHSFTYTPVNLTESAVPPDVGAGTNSTRYHYNLDKQLIQVQRPDGQTIDYSYDAAGRTGSFTILEGSYSYSYHSTTGKLTGITTPDGLGLNYTFSGALPTQTNWSGVVTGSVGKTYDNDFRVSTISVNGANPFTYQYDNDSLLTAVKNTALGINLTLARNTQNGLLTGTALGSLTDSYSYNGFGEVTQYLAKYTTADLYKTEFSRDKLGRITQKIETIGGSISTFDYAYDVAGRLIEVKLNGAVQSSYGYDENGNRTDLNPSTGSGQAAPIAHYDAQDRLLDYNNTTYDYTANGELKTKSVGNATTSYHYDVLGNLRQVTLPGGTTLDYVIDGQNRRIGKKRNNVLEQGFLYQDSLKPIAELDGNNQVVSRFVYATGVNVPDFMIKGGVTYRIIRDHLGSPRLVVDIATNTVIQKMNYDVWGKVIQDTNPGFQPFGYAGGLYDGDTGLVRFGARDYDAETGRWTAKDPIGFEGGDTNLYGYVVNDPVNLIDPLGLINRVKLGVGAVNAANSFRLGLQGVGFAVASVFSYGIGQPEVGAPAAAIAAWKFNSAKSAAKRGGKQLGEGFAEPECNESYRNLLGLLPFGDKFDDKDEPLPQDLDLINGQSLTDLLGEFGTIF
ncbi:RHS repeat-associated core domain-containing protein [Methylobacter sp.]|uniref:NHL domain-containing protein n=1 Tax=Methylobacter sp. TaxID=2051955 RepID=UPI0025E7E527|nr:RHS repeat-associated core domain-containing protein [Methylobacter sp.]